MRTYIEVLNDLETCLNGKLNKANAEVFNNLIHEFKTNFNKGISTKFLRDLINNKPNRIKTYRISYFLKKCKLKTQKELRNNFREWVLNKYAVDVITYTHDTRFKTRETEKAFIQDIRKQNVGNLSYAHKNQILHFIKT